MENFGLKIEETKLWVLYRIHARNGRIGLFNGRGFFLIRTKWCEIFLEEEIHWDRGGSAFAIRELEKSPWAVPPISSLGPAREAISEYLHEKIKQYRNEP